MPVREPSETRILSVASEHLRQFGLKRFTVVAVAEEAGGSLEDIVKINVYLTDLAHFIKFNEIMARYVPEPYPARAVVGVAALPLYCECKVIEVRGIGWMRLTQRGTAVL